MIYRRILKVKTVGSRNGEVPLQPDLTDFAVKYSGINFAVHEYNEKEGWCVVELWCSDHPVLEAKHQKTDKDLQLVDTEPAVMKVLTEHRLSPKILGVLSTSTHDSVDEEKKEITVRGRKGNFLRKEKHTTTAGKEQDEYVLDEG